jgi:WD40 repeat protein
MLPLPSSGQCHFTVAFSPDGRWLAAGGSACAVDVWDLHAPQNPARRIGSLHGPVIAVRFGLNDRLVEVSTTSIGFLHTTTGAFVSRPIFFGVRAQRAAVSDIGETVFVVRGTLDRWAVSDENARVDWSREDIPGAITDVAVTTTGRILAARIWPAGGGLIDIRAPARGDAIDTMPVTGRPHRLACSADGELAATLANGNLSVWNLRTRTAVADRANPVHGGWLSVAFAPHGRRIVTGGIDSTVAVWDAATDGPPLTTFQWGVGPVYAVAFDRDGLRAAAAGHSGAIVWDVDE